jgi:hypothetical protein
MQNHTQNKQNHTQNIQNHKENIKKGVNTGAMIIMVIITSMLTTVIIDTKKNPRKHSLC